MAARRVRNTTLRLLRLRGDANAGTPFVRAGPGSGALGLHGRGGFTLIEVLVAIAIILVLLGVVSTSLRTSRDAAARASMLSLGGQHAAVFAMYATDNRGDWPFLVDPWALELTVFTAADGGRYEARFCDTIFAWNIALADGYYNSDTRSKVFAPRGGSRGYWANFNYGLAFTTRPEFWDLRTRQPAPLQFASTRTDEVEWPSRKALLVENALEAATPLRNLTPVVGLVDGHAVLANQARWAQPGPAPPQELTPRWTLVANPWFGPFNATEHGVRGRDFE